LSAKKKPKREPVDGEPKKQEKTQELSLKQRLIKALAHPLRVQILAFMNDREWSPNELSEELVEGLSQVSYHVKVLRDFKLIEMTKTEPRRGAVEHYYRAVERAYIPSEMAKHIPKSGQRIIADDILEEVDKDVGASIKSGRFYARDDVHVSWTPADMDGEGCTEANELADEFVKRFLKIGGKVANRRANGEGDGAHIAISAALLVFGSELGEAKKAPSRKRGKKKKGK
jgi:DNA-binding transcriptional ArsR family regulator